MNYTMAYVYNEQYSNTRIKVRRFELSSQIIQKSLSTNRDTCLVARAQRTPVECESAWKETREQKSDRSSSNSETQKTL